MILLPDLVIFLPDLVILLPDLVEFEQNLVSLLYLPEGATMRHSTLPSAPFMLRSMVCGLSGLTGASATLDMRTRSASSADGRM